MNRRNVFHLPPNLKFRKFWVNGKRPKWLLLCYGYFFISFLLRDLFLRFFLNATNWNHKTVEFVVYSASSLWRCYNETNRGLHTATLASTSSSSCIMNCAEVEDRYKDSILLIIIYTKKILNSDWLRKECSSYTFVGLWKIYSCLFIPNCTRNHVITYSNCKPIACYDDWMTQ